MYEYVTSRRALAAAFTAFGLSACTKSNPETPTAEAAGEATKTVEVKMEEVGLSEAALDRKVKPCDDFYAFACGGWLEKTEIPGDKSRWVRSFSEIAQRNEQDLKNLLEKAVGDSSDDPVVQKVGTYFGACMDEKAVEDAGVAPLKPLMAAIGKVRNAKTLAPVLAQLHRHQVWAFFDMYPGQDFEDATQIIGQLDQNGLGLPERDYYLSDDEDKKKIRDAYEAHVARMLALAGAKEKAAKAAAKDVLRLETELAKVSKSPVERRDPQGMYNRLDLEGVKKAASQLNWDTYFETLGQPGLSAINVSAPEFLKGVGKLAASTKPQALQAYLRWHLLRTYASSLSQAFFDEAFSFKKTLTGQDEPQPRWKRCVASTDHALGDLLARPFVKLRFAGESKDAAEAYVREISQAFARNLDRLDWMDDETKAAARKKLEKFTYLVGYPSKWKSYDFEIGKVHAANLLEANETELQRELARIGKPVDHERWEMTPPTVNAYYHPLKNQMVFPAGILQPPFYAVTAHIPVNLGAMGMVVGHELTHGFDDQGSQFDGDGNLKMWWTEGSRKAFEEKTQCVVDQYAAYEPVPGTKLNGKLTLGENIADLGGLKLAFAAYRSMQAEAKERKVAGGFTEDQQFFIANAQVWCAKAKEAEMKRRAQVDPHSDPRSRVNGPMSNLSEFAEAFSCAPGTPMNPEKVCSVW